MSFLMMLLELQVWGEEDRRGKVPLTPVHIKGTYILATRFVTIDVDFDRLVGVVLVRFLSCKFTLFAFFSILYTLEKVPMGSPHVRNGELCNMFWGNLST